MRSFADFIFSGLELALKRVLNPLFHIDFIWNLTSSAKQLQVLCQDSYDVVLKVNHISQPATEVLLRIFA